MTNEDLKPLPSDGPDYHAELAFWEERTGARNSVHPGDNCPTCSRRVPFPKKATSPNTKPLAYRIPLDEADAHLEVLDAVAELLGISEEKFHRFKTISYCTAAVLLHGLRLESKDGG